CLRQLDRHHLPLHSFPTRRSSDLTIAKTKYELIEELPADGVAIFNYDNEDIKKLADKTFKEKRLYGLKDIENVDLYAENIVVSELGSSFVLKDKEGNRLDCTTKLLG